MLIRLVAVLVSVVALGPSAAIATDVTSCGQQIAAGEHADLTTDLDCSGAFGVELGRHATLELHGHTITMDQPTAVAAVTCLNGCVVDGPGTLVHPRADLATDDPVDGIRVFRGRLVASDLDISGFNEGINTILAHAGATISDVDAHDCSAIGIAGHRLALANVTANDNGTVNATTFQQYGTGISGGAVKGQHVTATYNVEAGIAGARVTLTSALVTGSAIGVSGINHVKLTDSSVTGASVADVRSAHEPKVVNTPCDHSSSTTPPFTPWGVCALD